MQKEIWDSGCPESEERSEWSTGLSKRLAIMRREK
jgi:hypothetical protein